jgi:hypothetical protein
MYCGDMLYGDMLYGDMTVLDTLSYLSMYIYVICGAYLCCCDDHSSHRMLLVSCMRCVLKYWMLMY